MSIATPSLHSSLPANDLPARPLAVYQTHAGAQTYAIKRAMAESPEGLAKPVEFVPNAWQPKGGRSICFIVESCQPGDDYQVREASQLEITRVQQANMRAEVERLYEQAATEDAAADRAKAACFILMHSKWAAQARSKARDLETRLTVSGVRDCVPFDCSEPITSSERDSREVAS